jgi:hypothetical protein
MLNLGLSLLKFFSKISLEEDHQMLFLMRVLTHTPCLDMHCLLLCLIKVLHNKIFRIMKRLLMGGATGPWGHIRSNLSPWM